MGQKKIRIQNLVLGMFATNTYFFQNPDTNEMLLIDPADDADAIIRKINAMEGIPGAILLTHGHMDHILAVREIKERYHIPVYAHEAEEEVLGNPVYNLSDMFGRSFTLAADVFCRDMEVLNLAGYEITVYHTPGHTKGSCCYYLKEAGVLASGDTLFAGSCGRTDLPTASTLSIIASLRRLVTELPEDTAVYPGHNESTTIGYERKYNSYIHA